LRPDYADGYLSRAAALQRQLRKDVTAQERQELFQRILRDLDVAVEKEPEDFYPYLHRAEAYREQGEWLRAVADCDSAIRRGAAKNEPDFYHTHETRGAAHRALGRYDEAIQDYTSAIKCFPSFIQGGPQDVSVLFAARGRTYLDQHAWNEAINDLT